MATLYTVHTAAGFLHAELTLDEAASLLGADDRRKPLAEVGGAGSTIYWS